MLHANERELKQLYDILIFQHVIKIQVNIITSIYNRSKREPCSFT